jgi:hypothetical protein
MLLALLGHNDLLTPRPKPIVSLGRRVTVAAPSPILRVYWIDIAVRDSESLEHLQDWFSDHQSSVLFQAKIVDTWTAMDVEPDKIR